MVPPAPVEKLAGRKVCVLDPGGELPASLKKLAPKIKLVKLPAKADVVLVGPFAHRDLAAVAAAAKEIEKFAAGGGRVVVLEQDRSIAPLGLEMPRVQGNGGSSTAFRKAPRDFYAWRGLGDDDRVLRRFNGPTGAVVRRPLKAAEGDEVLLVAAQDSGELDWPVLVRRKAREGERIFCQMPLHRHLAGGMADPVARTIMINLLAP